MDLVSTLNKEPWKGRQHFIFEHIIKRYHTTPRGWNRGSALPPCSTEHSWKNMSCHGYLPRDLSQGLCQFFLGIDTNTQWVLCYADPHLRFARRISKRKLITGGRRNVIRLSGRDFEPSLAGASLSRSWAFLTPIRKHVGLRWFKCSFSFTFSPWRSCCVIMNIFFASVQNCNFWPAICWRSFEHQLTLDNVLRMQLSKQHA